eukprot:sb/3471469/
MRYPTVIIILPSQPPSLFQEVVTTIWDTSVQLNLNTDYQDIIRAHLALSKYQLPYVCRTRQVSELQTLQCWTLQGTHQIASFLSGEEITVRAKCQMNSCTKDGEHGASVRLCNNAGRIDSVDVTPTEHSHTGYKHWFLVKDNGQFVSLYTTPHAALVTELKKIDQSAVFEFISGMIIRDGFDV